ncbi:MAG: hypothetical protein GW808_11910 [Sphingomonadales bacterium]|nr:hypothetical protein [Sphingomonadales bacterium]NCO98778.1 hypothetical protein [Sphingomonadales bacterium]NCP25729.1 hypothetical protein [Sphingomonadales bacterium]NCP50144.1 hypothetical protein [Sphingomonadales bacterium]NCQ09883.1 hypothetical protein [Sphingomonadales bacterium]
MKNALERLFELTSQIAREGVSLVPRVVPADAPFVQYQHYPKGDCIAPGNKSRWFYHAHKPEEREEGEHGHFHMFLPLEMFDGVEPYYQPPAKLPNGKKTQGVVHFGALSFGLDGMPISWFTTNYWVTYEYMMPAEAIASQLTNFDMSGAPGDPLVNDWLTAAVQHFHDPIIEMVHKRDHVLMAKKQELGSAVFENKTVEILSRQPFDL